MEATLELAIITANIYENELAKVGYVCHWSYPHDILANLTRWEHKCSLKLKKMPVSDAWVKNALMLLILANVTLFVS